MASTPTTKSQVQAYRFVLRRMESALVRKDSVMLHDPMGSHKRATMVGVALACVGLVGFLVWGLFGGKGSVPQPGSIVIGKDSGSVYVVTSDDKAQKRLIPMLNMASAKLLAMSQSQGGSQGNAPQPTTVKEAALAEFPRGPRTGMVNAPTYLPDAQNQAAPFWAICERGTNVGGSKPKFGEVETTVLGGEPQHGTPLQPNQSLFVQDQTTHQQYLVYVPYQMPGQPDTHIVKAPIDQSSTTLKDVYGLNGQTPRTMSTHMLNTIPSEKKLEVPSRVTQLQQSQTPATYMQARNPYRAGEVVERSLPDEQKEYYLLLPDGKQQISQGAAVVLHAAKRGSGNVPNATYAVTQAPKSQQPVTDLDTFPLAKPAPVTWQQSDGSCLSWKNEGGRQNITATLNSGQMTPKAPVRLAQSDGNGPQVDNFYMPAGKAAVVRSTPNEAGAASGQLGLISDQGVSYGIKDTKTAQGLGVIGNANDAKAGPAWLTRVLPRGAFLDPAESTYAYDSIPVQKDQAVNRPRPKQQ